MNKKDVIYRFLSTVGSRINKNKCVVLKFIQAAKRLRAPFAKEKIKKIVISQKLKVLLWLFF